MTKPIEDPNGPGFKYNSKPEVLSVNKKIPTYSFGQGGIKKRHNALLLKVSTPESLGPNAYLPNYLNRSEIKRESTVKIGTYGRFKENNKKCMNETYYLYSSIGTQQYSKKLNERVNSVGKSSRGGPSGLMPKKNFMVQLKHAVF